MTIDVLIIGAGPAGAVGATRLAMAGAKVVLIDKLNVVPEKVGESLPPLAAHLIQALGMEAAFDTSFHLPAYGVRSAWGSGDKERPFILSPYGHGWLLDRPAFDQSLRDFATTKGVHIIHPAQADTIFIRRDRYHFRLLSGSQPISGTASAILDCSGRSSDFALRHGATRITYDRLVAFWCLFHGRSVRDQDNHTTIESARDGWYYTAKIPRDRRVVVFLTDGDLPSCKRAKCDSSWSSMLSETRLIQSVLESGSYKRISKVHVASASSTRLTSFCRRSWLAAGDAAMSFDPLSSRGIFQAMASASNAAAALIEQNSGRSLAFHNYDEQMNQHYEDYLAELPRKYETEGSFTSEFWQRRSRHQ